MDIKDNNAFVNYGLTTPFFTLNGQCSKGRLVDIVDGDSVYVILPVFNNYYKYSVRLNGIDTCEMKSKNEQLKKRAILARNTLLKLVDEKIDVMSDITKVDVKNFLNENVIVVWVECLEFDKYGRLLANVYALDDNDKKTGDSFSDHLLKKDLAYAYMGKTKLTEDEQLNEIK
jgi:endonuclease YncB( thermonuclease family)